MINSYVIDRRLNGKNKSAVNRRRFLERYRKHVKEAVNQAVNKRSITDMEKGESITIPSKDLHEPVIGHGKGGDRSVVHPGNKEFSTGDRIRKPQGGQGQGNGSGQASPDGEGLDEFTFYISQDEFLEFLFDDLELPNMVRKDLKKSQEFERHRAGFSSEGIPTNINVVRSLRNAHARRIALGGKKRKRIKEIDAELAEIKGRSAEAKAKRTALEEEKATLLARLKKLPFIDDFDLRYNRHEMHPVPSSAAVMFCLMDVSGSMTQGTKDIAKRFFLLLYLFLRRNYQKIEVVFIRHHTSAKEVDEQEFFYSRETGGTIVSSALQMMNDIVQKRYPASSWNIFAAQASDGDNWGDDSPVCRDVLLNHIMPSVQYFSYIEISPRDHQDLWYAYEDVKTQYPEHFAMAHILEKADIYPVFRELFQRKNA